MLLFGIASHQWDNIGFRYFRYIVYWGSRTIEAQIRIALECRTLGFIDDIIKARHFRAYAYARLAKMSS